MFGGGGASHAARQAAKGDCVPARQSQTGQKLQSISEHWPVFFRFARHDATQVGFVTELQRSPMYPTNAWPAHLLWTAASSVAQAAFTLLSSQARKRPPPQMHAIWGSHSLGHQHASVRAVQRSL